jgi:hypothetical protein
LSWGRAILVGVLAGVGFAIGDKLIERVLARVFPG